MTITVKDTRTALTGPDGQPTEGVWQSPDKKITIYEITDADANVWSTFSHRIGKGVGQSFDVEVYQKKNKTYIRPKQEGDGYQAQQPTPVPKVSVDMEDFHGLVTKLEALVIRLEAIMPKETEGYKLSELPEGEPAQSTLNSPDADDFFG